MKKVPKKIYLDEALTNFIDGVADHYGISKSNIIEDLLLAAVFPLNSLSVRIKIIELDEHYKVLKNQLEVSLK